MLNTYVHVVDMAGFVAETDRMCDNQNTKLPIIRHVMEYDESRGAMEKAEPVNPRYRKFVVVVVVGAVGVNVVVVVLT